MIVFWISFAGIVVIFGVASWLVVGRCDGSHEPRHRATSTRWETEAADDAFAETIAGWNRPPGTAPGAPPEVSHEEWLPATPALPPIAGLPVRRPPSYDRGQPGVLLPPIDLAAAVAIVLTGMIASAGQREAAERLATQDEIILLQAEVGALRDADTERRRDLADFPHLFAPEVQYSQWDWRTDSGIMAAITGAEPAVTP